MTINLNQEEFKEKVFDYATGEAKYSGDKPALIDFWADWCQPCRMVAPILEKLSEEFKDDIYIYKVNVDENEELSTAFAIQSIPSLLFVPKDGQLQMALGVHPEDKLRDAIKEVLLK